MKRLTIALLLLIFVIAFSACSKRDTKNLTRQSTSASTSETADDVSNIDLTESAREDEMKKITISVNGKEFTASLYDNETANAFAAKLPVTIKMQELHGNEKYYYLEKSLPSSPAVPDIINNGDIKLFGSDCLVLFYDSFTTSYSYTDIGKVDNPDGLKAALGSGDIEITFE